VDAEIVCEGLPVVTGVDFPVVGAGFPRVDGVGLIGSTAV